MAKKSINKDFYSGIITAPNLLDLHGEETVFDELVAMCDLKELVSVAIAEGEFEWSGLAKREYAQQYAHLTLGESAPSQSFSNAETVSTSDSVPPSAPAQVTHNR